MTTLNVGVGLGFATIASAVNAAKDGDTINVQSGTYKNDFLNFDKDITLQAVNGMVKMVETVQPPNGKAMITESGNVAINGFDISGVSVRDNNGAAIRYQGGNLTLNDDYFHNNQDGMLTAADPNGNITINHSEFAFNGTSAGNTHNLYVGGLNTLKINNSYFHDANVGHEIKSRANNTIVTNSRILDNNGSSSYSVDLPNGGNATIKNNVIEQGKNGQNSNIIAYAEENQNNAGHNVSIVDNEIVNDKGSGTLLLNPHSIPIDITGNTIFGLDANYLGNGAVATSNDFVSTRPTVDTTPLSFLGNPTPVPPPQGNNGNHGEGNNGNGNGNNGNHGNGNNGNGIGQGHGVGNSYDINVQNFFATMVAHEAEFSQIPTLARLFAEWHQSFHVATPSIVPSSPHAI